MDISKFGSMFIQLSQGSFSPGQQVNGVINLNLIQQIPGANQIYLVLAGMEMVSLNEHQPYFDLKGRNTKSKDINIKHGEEHTVCNYRFPVYTFTSDFMPQGMYSFPFSFILDANLPSSFSLQFSNPPISRMEWAQCSASVEYNLMAFIDDNNPNTPPIRYVQKFNVNQADVANLGVHKCSIRKDHNSCACFGQGSTVLTSHFEKNEYCPGETAHMLTEIDNSASNEIVQAVTTIFSQKYTFKAGTYTHIFTVNHQESTTRGIEAGGKLPTQRLEVKLVGKKDVLITPTCRGKLVKNEYFLLNRARVDPSCNCDSPYAEATMFVTIRNPDMEYQKWVQPQNWQPKVMPVVQFQPGQQYQQQVFPPELIVRPPVVPENPANNGVPQHGS